jgi:tyrosyl-DNA phosphodiesterase 1
MCVLCIADLIMRTIRLTDLTQVTNYELGVAFPLKDDDHIDRIACWERPPKKYVLGDDVPWVS